MLHSLPVILFVKLSNFNFVYRTLFTELIEFSLGARDGFTRRNGLGEFWNRKQIGSQSAHFISLLAIFYFSIIRWLEIFEPV